MRVDVSLLGHEAVADEPDPDAVVRRTAGVTASFIKELMRKAALIGAIEADGTGAPTVTDAHLGEALDELLSDESEMTRALLGGSVSSSQPGSEWLLQAGPE